MALATIALVYVLLVTCSIDLFHAVWGSHILDRLRRDATRWKHAFASSVLDIFSMETGKFE